MSGFSIRLSSGKTIQLSPGARVSAADLAGLDDLSGAGSIAEVVRNPNDANGFGLKNLTQESWQTRLPSGEHPQIEPGRSVRLAERTVITLGNLTATVRVASGAFSLNVGSGPAVALKPGSKVAARDLVGIGAADGTVAVVEPYPNARTIMGLKNQCGRAWSAKVATGEQRTVDPGRSLRLAAGWKIDFGGGFSGEIQGSAVAAVGGQQASLSSRLPSRTVMIGSALAIVVVAAVIELRSRSPHSLLRSSGAGSAVPVTEVTPIPTDWDKPFASPQYLLHVTGNDDYYFLNDAPAGSDGNVTTTNPSGASVTDKTDLSKGPFKTPREVCSAAKSIPVGTLSPPNSLDAFNCAESLPAEATPRS